MTAKWPFILLCTTTMPHCSTKPLPSHTALPNCYPATLPYWTATQHHCSTEPLPSHTSLLNRYPASLFYRTVTQPHFPTEPLPSITALPNRYPATLPYWTATQHHCSTEPLPSDMKTATILAALLVCQMLVYTLAAKITEPSFMKRVFDL